MEPQLGIHPRFPTPSLKPRVPIHLSDSLLCGFENQRDRPAQTLPPGGLGIQLLPSRFGEAIELRVAPTFGGLPLGFEPTSVLQPVKSGIKRPLANLKRVF